MFALALRQRHHCRSTSTTAIINALAHISQFSELIKDQSVAARLWCQHASASKSIKTNHRTRLLWCKAMQLIAHYNFYVWIAPLFAFLFPHFALRIFSTRWCLRLQRLIRDTRLKFNSSAYWWCWVFDDDFFYRLNPSCIFKLETFHLLMAPVFGRVYSEVVGALGMTAVEPTRICEATWKVIGRLVNDQNPILELPSVRKMGISEV